MEILARFHPFFIAALLGLLHFPGTAPGVELPFPVELLQEEAAISDPPNMAFTNPNDAAISGDVAVSIYPGRVYFNQRQGDGWRYQGTLNSWRFHDSLTHNLTVALAGETLAVGVDGAGFASVHVYERGAGPGFNAWNVSDESWNDPPIHYTVDLSPAQRAEAGANGWRYRMVARNISIPFAGHSVGFSFGDGTRRYGVLFRASQHTDQRLHAQLPGAPFAGYFLTPDETGAEDYHTHELVFDPATQLTTYFFNGDAIHAWQGEADAQSGVSWGAFSDFQTGAMNVREARFEILESGEVAAHYFAGIGGNPEIAPDPADQGWTASAPNSDEQFSEDSLMYAGPHSPDPATVWELRQVEDFPSNTGIFDWDAGPRIAIDGDTMVVGVLGDSTSLGTHSGAAHVLERDGGAWVRRTTLKPGAVVAHDRFGRSVVIDGGTILVGAPGPASPPDTRTGRAFVFTGSGATWTQQAILTASDGAARDGFGVSVALEGNRAAVGADSKGIGSASFAGAAYVFERSGVVWAEEAQVTAQPLSGGGQFGHSLDLHGGMLLVADHRRPAHFLFARGATPAEWNLVDSRVYTGANYLVVSAVAFDRAANRFLVETMDPTGGTKRTTYIYGADYGNAAELATYARKYLYAPESAAAAIPFDPNQAAFRYKHLLYGEDSGSGQIRARHEIMDTFYGPEERSLALAVEGELRKGLAFNPDNPLLGDLLLDIYYDRATAEAILTKNLVAATERARFGPPLANPPPANGFIIDNEILRFRDLLAAAKTAMAGYFALLSDDLGLPGNPPRGFTMFRDLVPDRGLMAATYDDGGGGAVPVTGEAMLFSGYKDLVLLFELLRDHGRAAHSLARLLVARDGPGDRDEAGILIAENERFLYLQGSLLERIFPELPGPEDPSGLAQAIEGWSSALESLANLRQIIAGEANLLGFAPDFLMLIENFTGPGSDIFDSFDVFKQRLSLSTLDSTLRRARDRLQTARDAFGQFRGYEDQILDQFDQSTSSYESRLFEIVGARPGELNYSDIPNANPGSELDQQYRSIQLAGLKIQRNQTEIDNLAKEVRIEINRAADASNVFIRYGDLRADITARIGHIKAEQKAADAVAEALSTEKFFSVATFVGLANGAYQRDAEIRLGELEAGKERLAAAEQSEIEGINSAARVKTLLLGMHTLAVDSTEAALLMRQEIARMAALYREKSELESRIAESNSELASRYFADPVHRLAADWRMIEANLGFEDAQRWLFFMVRALEFKWNTPFSGFAHDGRAWSARTLFKLRNADELEAFFNAMNAFDALINRGKTYRFDWFSVREDFMGLKTLNDEGQPAEYIDPVTGETHDAIGMFRAILGRSVRPVQGGQEIAIEFNTVRQIPGGFFFVGPTFNLNGSVSSPGRFLNKIDYLQIRLPGDHSLGRSQLAGNLTYGGTSFVRNFNVGQFAPDRSDRLVNEMTAYNTRYWFFDPTPGQQRWKFNEGLTINAVEMQLSDDPRLPPTVTQILEFKERSVAATGWRLTIPLVQQNTQVMKLDELNDIEIYFHHYSAQRQ